MNFLNPWFAAAVAAVVVPALLILYFLKLRRREQVVASTLLWKRAIQDLQVNAPFRRLRRNLLLFLQLLILGAGVFALARPIIRTEVANEERVVILIDRSASMNTREGDVTRLDLAKEQAERRRKLQTARALRKQENLKLRQRRLPWAEGESSFTRNEQVSHFVWNISAGT